MVRIGLGRTGPLKENRASLRVRGLKADPMAHAQNARGGRARDAARRSRLQAQTRWFCPKGAKNGLRLLADGVRVSLWCRNEYRQARRKPAC